MIHHLEVSTITAVVCVLAALALPRSAASLRHLVLLLGILRFAAYTPWLTELGFDLSRFVPDNRPATPHLLHVTLHLLADTPAAPKPSALPPSTWIELKDAGWWIWYAVAAFSAGVWLGGLARPVRATREAHFWERDIFLHIATKMKMERKAGLRIVAPDTVPGAQGWLRPRVLLPDGLIHQLDESELEPVLAHELAHLRRRDPLIAGIVRGIVAVFWFHPLLRWMERRMLAEREAACDQLALASGAAPQDYVAGIAKICRATAGGAPSYAGVTGANLAQRIEHILSFQPRREWPRAITAIPVVLAMMAELSPVAGGLLRAQQARFDAAGVSTPVGREAAELQAALMLEGVGRHDEAIPLYLRILQADPDSVVALNNLAYLLAEHGQSLDRALVYATRAHQLKPGWADIDDTLGWVYLKRSDPSDAILLFRDSVLAQPNNFAFRSHLAQALDQLPNPADWARELHGLIFASGPAADTRLRELLETIGQ